MSRRPRDLRPVFLEPLAALEGRDAVRRLADRLRAAMLADLAAATPPATEDAAADPGPEPGGEADPEDGR